MTETQERFLRAVAERLPLDRVAEVHLFPSIRQGGVETGVAVIAVEAEGAGPTEGEAHAQAPGEVPSSAAALDAAASEVEVAGDEAVSAGGTDAVAGEAAGDEATGVGEPAGGEAVGAPPQHQDSADDADRPHRSTAHPGDSPPAPRHTIFSARYRLTLKGPDRGRWEAEVVAEADAPLATADLVVRGVRKRTGEAAEAERVSPEALRQLVAQPA